MVTTSHAVPAPTSLLIRTANAFPASYTLIATGEIDGFASDTVRNSFNFTSFDRHITPDRYIYPPLLLSILVEDPWNEKIQRAPSIQLDR